MQKELGLAYANVVDYVVYMQSGVFLEAEIPSPPWKFCAPPPPLGFQTFTVFIHITPAP